MVRWTFGSQVSISGPISSAWGQDGASKSGYGSGYTTVELGKVPDKEQGRPTPDVLLPACELCELGRLLELEEKRTLDPQVVRRDILKSISVGPCS